MNRCYIVLAKVEDIDEIAPLHRLFYAESNSPNNKPRLSGRPEVKDAIKELLEMLPAAYDKLGAMELVGEAVEEVFV